MVSKTKKFIYIHIIKCGGTSIEHIIKPYLHEYSNSNNPFGDHAFMCTEHKALTEKEYNSYYKFTVVRHPLTKLASLWHVSNRGGGFHRKNWQNHCDVSTFPTFIQNLPKLYEQYNKPNNWSYYFTPQVEWLKIDGKIKLDKIIHLKNLNNEWREIAHKFDLNPNIGKERVSGTSNETYLSLYTQEMKDIVYETYKEDMEEFKFEVI